MLKELVKKYLKYFAFYYKRLRWRIFLLLGISTLVALLDGIGLTLFIPMFEHAENMASAKEDMGQMSFIIDVLDYLHVPKSIGGILLFMLLLFVVKGVFKYFERFYSVILRVSFARQLRLGLVNGITNLSYKGFLGLDAGKLQNVITGEIGKSVAAFTNYFTALQTGVTLIAYLSLAFASNFQFALLIPVSGLLSQFIYQVFYKMVESTSYLQSLQGHGLQSNVIQTVAHFKFLKATGLVKPYSRFLKNNVEEVERLSKRMGKLNAISTAMREPIIIIASVIFIQVDLLGSSITSIILPLIFFYRSLTNLMQVQTAWQSFLTSSGGIASVDEMYAEFKAIAEPSQSKEKIDFKDEIKLRDVSFSYNSKEAKQTLSKVNLSVKKYSTIAFVGESGSGKTTLINLIAGLLQPTSGTISVDDIEITDRRLAVYRNKIGYITQEPVIFNDTLYNNITFWQEKTPENEARFWEVLKQTALFDFVKGLADQENIQLGDNGILISGGQKQRISIARELYRSCEILLMDEATSALDSETEKIIQESTTALKGKLTILIIAHRLSTVKEADIIYLLDQGEVVASGSFNDLQNSSERFKRMVALQEF